MRQPRHTHTASQRGAIALVESSTGRTHALFHRPNQRGGQSLENGDIEPTLPGARSNVRTDETGTDHNGARARIQDSSDRDCVIEGPHGMNAAHASRPRKFSRVGAGRDNECVIRDSSVADQHSFALGIQIRCRRAEYEADAQFVPQGFFGSEYRRPRSSTIQHAVQARLRQRRPVIR